MTLIYLLNIFVSTTLASFTILYRYLIYSKIYDRPHRPPKSKKVQHGTYRVIIIGLHNFIIGLHNLSSGYAILVPNFLGDNLKYRVTLVPLGAGVVCHIR